MSSPPATQIEEATATPASTMPPIINPTTPTMGSTTTPNLSSPDTPRQPETPYAKLQTPAGSAGSAGTSNRRNRLDTVDEGIIYHHSDLMMDGGQGLGLGYGDAKGKMRDLGREDVLENTVEAVRIAASKKRRRSQSNESDEEQVVVERFPDTTGLLEMQRMLQEIEAVKLDGMTEKEELVAMVRSLLTPSINELPFLHGQISAQRATIRTLQQQARLAHHMTIIERERHTAERASWNAETRALLAAKDADVVAGTKGKKVLDLDVGYHQELEAANKRLEMDNRLMAPRLADTQRQIENLVTELRHLRPHVILSSHPLAEPPIHPPSLPRSVAQSPAKSSLHHTMGDARAEHLLLAAKKVRAMRAQDERVGRLTLEELKRGGVVGPDGGLGYSEGYGAEDVDAEGEEDYYEESEVEEEKPIVGSSAQERRPSAAKGKGRTSQPQSTATTPLLPRAKRISKRSLPPPTTPSRNRTQPPTTTPGGSNFNDLLRAAELATRPGTPTPTGKRTVSVPMSVTSAARSTSRRDENGNDDQESPLRKHRRVSSSGIAWNAGARRIRGMDLPEGEALVEENEKDFPGSEAATPSTSAHPTEASALDLLAQASSLDYAQSDERGGPAQSSINVPALSSASRFEGLMTEVKVSSEGSGNGVQSPRSSAGESALGPAISLRSSPPTTTISISQPRAAVEADHPIQIDPELTNLPRPEQVSVSADPTTSASMSGPMSSTPQSKTRQVEIVTPARSVEFMPTSSDVEDISPSFAVGNVISPSPHAKQEYYDPPFGAFSSPTGAAVPGLGKYVHLTSSMPARRVRSPYLKWTIEEDELLARAVAIHGEKWDLVSKGVPTRSYHQVRQRWLRKTGAFDKKPPQSELDSAMGGMGGGGMERGDYVVGNYDDDREETSPTPHGGRTPVGKKRKLQGLGIGEGR